MKVTLVFLGKMFILLNIAIALITGIVLSIFTLYLDLAYLLDLKRIWPYNDMKNLSEYDYIIVGGGSAGAVLASRLAQDQDERVMLLEAGGTAPFFLDIPLLAPILQETFYDWQYKTVPQANACMSLENKTSKWPMGKVLGGTSRLNYMAYARGHPKDYQGWFTDFEESVGKERNSMSVSDLKWSTPLADAILSGLREMGQPIANINEGERTGFMKAQVSMENGRRWSSDRVLRQAEKENLEIVTHAFATKVLLESRVATGIQFSKSGQRFVALARKGVILSSGTIGSPKLLMLSGIGPKKHLEELEIDTIVDLPVGKHLVDHVLTGLDLITLNSSLGLSMADALNPVSAINYFLYGEGPWTSSGIEVLGTFASRVQKNQSLPPDLQLMTFPLGVSKDRGLVLKKVLGIKDSVYQEYFASLVNENAITIAPVLLHPKSKGELKLQSKNPFEQPLINPRYLTNSEDVATLVEGLQFVMKLVKTKSMRALGASVYKQSFPGCKDKVFGSKDYWECYIRHLTLTAYHPAGTCRMGDVVDQAFRVYGTWNLFVVDASVFRYLPSGNIQAAVIMLAEKAARVFKGRNKSFLDDRIFQKKLKTAEPRLFFEPTFQLLVAKFIPVIARQYGE